MRGFETERRLRGTSGLKERVEILNASFDPLTSAETVQLVFDALATGTRGWVCTLNVATLMAMRKDARLQSFADRRLAVVADGQPLVWCAPTFGGKLPERVAGIDLIDDLCRRAASEGSRVYLLGATQPLVDKALTELRTRHPGLRAVGADGYFRQGEALARVAAIRASRARLLFVGMGSPRQEAFIQQHFDALGIDVAIGVGGSFDVIGGARLRAPRWIRRIGMEWLVRMVQEPRRLLPRYATTNTTFLFLIAKTVLAKLDRWRRRWTNVRWLAVGAALGSIAYVVLD